MDGKTDVNLSLASFSNMTRDTRWESGSGTWGKKKDNQATAKATLGHRYWTLDSFETFLTT